MSQRFYVETPILSERAVLSGAEAHHLAHVMRLQVGDEAILFDGSGAEFSARVAKIGRVAVDLAIVARRETNRELPFTLVLGVALPKGERQKWLVEKATELGVTRIVPLVTMRGVAQPVDQAIDRLRRTVVEASKQCGRNRLLEIALPLKLTEFLAMPTPGNPRFLAHPSGAAMPHMNQEPIFAGGVYLAVGPEGGFTDDEIGAALAHGWQLAGLGPRILRVETAVLALCGRFAC